MISIEEIITLQKRDEATRKKSESGKKASKGLSDVQGHSSKGKEKEKRITIKEGASRPNKQTLPRTLPSPSKMEKERWGNRLRLLLLLGNVRARMVQLRCFKFPLLRLQMKGW